VAIDISLSSLPSRRIAIPALLSSFIPGVIESWIDHLQSGFLLPMSVTGVPRV